SAILLNSSGRSSNPEPATQPSTGEGASAARSDRPAIRGTTSIPRPIGPANFTQRCAISSVSSSVKKSSTSGTKPARRAAAASPRPEMATIRIVGKLLGELLCKCVCVAEIEVERFVRLDHPVEQSGLGLVFDVTDRECTDRNRFSAGNRGRVVVDADAFDARWWHCIHIGDDLQIFGLLELIQAQQSFAGRTGGKH